MAKSSKDYWREREEAQRKKNLRDQQEYNQQIRAIYLDTMDRVQKEIDSFYARYAQAEGITMAEAKKRVAKLDMEAYARKAKRYVKDKDFSKQANEEMKLYNLTMKVNRLELLKANIGLELVHGFNALQQFYDQTLTDKTLEEFERQAGILGMTVTDADAAKRATSIVNASFHNATWSDRIWMHQDLLKSELSKLLQTGLIQGKNPNVLARELRKVFDVSCHDAERLMRTELARVQTAAQRDSYARNGYEEYEFICCGAADACDVCRALDGKIFAVKNMLPGTNAAPMHPGCHCSSAAHMDRSKFQEWLDENSREMHERTRTESTGERAKKTVQIAAQVVASGSVSGIIKKKDDLQGYVGKKIVNTDNQSVREWYVANVQDIPNQIDKSLTTEQQARQAYELRTKYKHEAREAMSDKETAELLEKKRPAPTFDELIASKMKRKNMTREEAVEDILKTASKTNSDVNKEFGLEGE